MFKRRLVGFAMSVRIVRRRRQVRWARARDILTTKRAGRTASTTLKEQQTANQQTQDDCCIQHNSHEVSQMRFQNRVTIHFHHFRRAPHSYL
jgi:hypothetical protein